MGSDGAARTVDLQRGWTALHHAARNHQEAVTAALLARRVNVDCATADAGCTALHLASGANALGVVQLLLAAGANATAHDLVRVPSLAPLDEWRACAGLCAPTSVSGWTIELMSVRVQHGRVPVEHNPGSQALRSLLGPLPSPSPSPPPPPPRALAPPAATHASHSPRRDVLSPVQVPSGSPRGGPPAKATSAEKSPSLRAVDMAPSPSPSPRTSLSTRIRNQVRRHTLRLFFFSWSGSHASQPRTRRCVSARMLLDMTSPRVGCERTAAA
jgi:hypothetical protein